MKRSIGIFTIIVLMLAFFTAVTSAQNGGRRLEPTGEIVEIITETTGLTVQEIRDQMRAGTTLSELITANGGDANAVATEAVAVLTERINQAVADGVMPQERADDLLSNLESRVADFLNGEAPLQNLRERRGEHRNGIQERIGMQLMQSVVDATGLSPQELMQQVRDGGTIADAIVANGGDVEAIVTQAVNTVTEAVNEAVANNVIDQERADEILSNLETRLTDAINGDADLRGLIQRQLQGRRGEGNRAQAIVQEVAAATDLEPQAVVEAVQAGSTLADVLTTNGVDVDAFVNDVTANLEARLAQAVEAGRTSQTVADARLNLHRAQLIDALNRTFEPATAD